MKGTILIASDATSGSEGALRVGLAHAAEKHLEAEVLTVLEPFATYRLAGVGGAPEGYALLASLQAEDLRRKVAAQVESSAGEAASARVVVRVGSPAPSIVRHAREIGAELIVLGAGPSTPVDRWLRSETALKVVRLAHVPVLAVHPSASGLPTRALVAVDFSRYSLRAARAVLQLLGEPAHLFLAHVIGDPVEIEPLPSLTEWREGYTREVDARLERLAEQLRSTREVDVESSVVVGDPARQLVGMAERLNVDVIAAGSHGFGYLGRVLMGGVSTRLLRGAHCSVLLAPPSIYSRDLDSLPPAAEPLVDLVPVP